MVVKMGILYNKFIRGPSNIIIALRCLLIKFEISKEIASVKDNQVKVRKGVVVTIRKIIKQAKVLMLETLVDRDRERE